MYVLVLTFCFVFAVRRCWCWCGWVQARIVALNSHYFLKVGGHFVISIKANCIDSTAAPEAVFAKEVSPRTLLAALTSAIVVRSRHELLPLFV